MDKVRQEIQDLSENPPKTVEEVFDPAAVARARLRQAERYQTEQRGY